jgi:hypothetical protein
MTRARLVACVLVVMACGALAACTTAHADQAQTTDARSSADSAPASALVSGSGQVHLTDYTDHDGTISTIIVTGAVGDYGSAKRDDGKGQLDLNLTQGSFRLNSANLDGRFLAQMRHLAVNQHSCSAEATASGGVPIVPGSGTAAYSNISGAFELTMTLDELYHPGACRETAPYLAQQIITTGWGNISHP